MSTKTAALRRKRLAVLDERSAIVQKAMKEKRGLTPAEETQDENLSAQADSLGNVITRSEEIEAGNSEFAAFVSVRERALDRPCGETFAACVLSIAGADLMTKRQGLPIGPEGYAKEILRDPFAAAALSASTIAGGGGMIRQDISEDLIELLRAKTVVRRAGAEEYPMPKNNLTISAEAGDPTATWVGEQVGAKASAPTFRAVELFAKKLRITCPISNDLIRFAGQRMVEKVLKQIQLAAAAAEDLAFLRGAGTAFTPKGLLSCVVSGQSHAPTADPPTVASVTTETGMCIQDLLAANSRMISPCWFWHPRSGVFLRSMRSTQGFKIWPEIDERNQFRGYPFYETTAIPINLNASDESEIYFVDAADIVIGQVPGIELRSSDEATYQDSTGTLVSAFDHDETVIDIIEALDLDVRHTGSLSVLTGVEYIP